MQKGNHLPGVAKQTAYAELSWLPDTGFRAGIDATYADKIYVNNVNSEYAPSVLMLCQKMYLLPTVGKREYKLLGHL